MTQQPTPPDDTILIRRATEADVPALLRGIRALADYEKLAHEVRATEEGLRAALFGEDAVAEAALAETGGTLVGFALYFRNFSTFLGKPGIYLEDLFVWPEWRGRGAGKALLRHLAQLVVDRGYGRLEWAVLDWNTPSIAFYRSLGAVPMDEWTVFRLTGTALSELARTPSARDA